MIGGPVEPPVCSGVEPALRPGGSPVPASVLALPGLVDVWGRPMRRRTRPYRVNAEARVPNLRHRAPCRRTLMPMSGRCYGACGTASRSVATSTRVNVTCDTAPPHRNAISLEHLITCSRVSVSRNADPLTNARPGSVPSPRPIEGAIMLPKKPSSLNPNQHSKRSPGSGSSRRRQCMPRGSGPPAVARELQGAEWLQVIARARRHVVDPGSGLQRRSLKSVDPVGVEPAHLRPRRHRQARRTRPRPEAQSRPAPVFVTVVGWPAKLGLPRSNGLPVAAYAATLMPPTSSTEAEQDRYETAAWLVHGNSSGSGASVSTPRWPGAARSRPAGGESPIA